MQKGPQMCEDHLHHCEEMIDRHSLSNDNISISTELKNETVDAHYMIKTDTKLPLPAELCISYDFLLGLMLKWT